LERVPNILERASKYVKYTEKYLESVPKSSEHSLNILERAPKSLEYTENCLECSPKSLEHSPKSLERATTRNKKILFI
jgi:hypothetical protein